MEKFLRFANALFLLVLAAILASAYFQQFFHHELPCPLCMLQRLGLFGVAAGLFSNLRNGIHARHYGFSLLCAVYGGVVSIRQIALHVCPGFPIFGIPVWGMSLYTWAFLAFSISIFAIGALLMLQPKERTSVQKMNRFEWLASLAILLLLVANVYTTYYQCQYGPCEDVPWPQPPSEAVSP